jgi:predicted transcriptional regulator
LLNASTEIISVSTRRSAKNQLPNILSYDKDHVENEEKIFFNGAHDAPWYVPNMIIYKDLQIPTVQNETSRYIYQYIKHFSVHPNELILNLQKPPEPRQL